MEVSHLSVADFLVKNVLEPATCSAASCRHQPLLLTDFDEVVVLD
jgi:hypothetical protein